MVMSDIDTSGGVFMVGTSGSQENGDDYLGLLSALLRRGIAESAIFSDFGSSDGWEGLVKSGCS